MPTLNGLVAMVNIGPAWLPELRDKGHVGAGNGPRIMQGEPGQIFSIGVVSSPSAVLEPTSYAFLVSINGEVKKFHKFDANQLQNNVMVLENVDSTCKKQVTEKLTFAHTIERGL